ncbi:hypothetical protein BTS2_0158 [Bacillus sp. TS-2]|nr:hypothetical protein BTS2_0158 [Bacillus sp. TS-2]
MARISESQNGITPFQKLLGHHKEIMENWTQLSETLENDGLLSAVLKEQVRWTLAQGNGCEYCKAKGKLNKQIFDEKISLAVGFAEVFLKYKGDIPSSIFNILYEQFNEAEISELCAFICFTTASHYFGALMELKP